MKVLQYIWQLSLWSSFNLKDIPLGRIGLEKKLYCLWGVIWWTLICVSLLSHFMIILEYILLDVIIAYYLLTKTIVMD